MRLSTELAVGWASPARVRDKLQGAKGLTLHSSHKEINKMLTFCSDTCCQTNKGKEGGVDSGGT